MSPKMALLIFLIFFDDFFCDCWCVAMSLAGFWIKKKNGCFLVVFVRCLGIVCASGGAILMLLGVHFRSFWTFFGRF